MTMYTEDVNYRMRTLFAFLAALSIILAYALRGLLPAEPWTVAPATLMFFAAMFWAFDALLWKLPVIRWLNSGIPNLAGYWSGNLVQVIEGEEKLVPARLTIKQTWSKLDLVLRTEKAVSRNKLAGLNLSHPEAIVLTWLYQFDGTNPLHLTDHGRGIIELTLDRRTKKPTFSGTFIASQPGEPLKLTFTRPGFFFWNDEPI